MSLNTSDIWNSSLEKNSFSNKLLSISGHSKNGNYFAYTKLPNIHLNVQGKSATSGKVLLFNKSSIDKVKRKENQNINKRLKIDCDAIKATPQKSQYSKTFRRLAPLPPDGIETYHGLPQPEPPTVPITGSDMAHEVEDEDTISLTREKENYSHYTYYSDKALFKCNLCGDKFTDNSNLLLHLKTKHMAVSRALKAQFSCAKCPAKFFKNEFMLKHSLTHAVQ